jgi:hypothetical protein
MPICVEAVEVELFYCWCIITYDAEIRIKYKDYFLDCDFIHRY